VRLVTLAGWVGVGLVLLTSCHAEPEKSAARLTTRSQEPTTPAAVPAVTQVIRATTPFTGYHRYRGTVGGQPVTVVLTITAKSEKPLLLVCEGSYRYDRHPSGQLLLSTPQPYQPQQPLLLAETDSGHVGQATGRWQATQPAGALLSGTWSSPGGKQLPFSLREDYTDGHGQLMAVHYEVLDERVEGPVCKPDAYEGETKAEYRQRLKDQPASSLDRQYLHLLGPEAAQPIWHLQCPSPRERRAAMRAALAEVGDCAASDDKLEVTYNDYGLLALGEYHEEYYQGTAHPNHAVEATIYDLHTGKTLALADLLKPGTDHALRQLITHKLQNEMELAASEILHPAEGDSTTTELPRTGVGLTAAGLTFQYSDYELGAYAYGMPYSTIAWAELLPLLRTDSPIARMLRQRGLWKQQKPR
jgi:hypothetical protein